MQQIVILMVKKTRKVPIPTETKNDKRILLECRNV